MRLYTEAGLPISSEQRFQKIPEKTVSVFFRFSKVMMHQYGSTLSVVPAAVSPVFGMVLGN